ncbi:hypothetical protein GL50803_0015240 [Giardia duodenalis]|uniref:Uncharacterized protein n=1 Tax=Giardia intestinalis (strain ATCC 50803 / WB clone C6) TaxID=184922 RepID=A8B9R3_GIAIC|nr:hypothetical protein GL50803_0015240 [Giardia intestinalis]KAE8306075.1 hypothetical protein GL50803_0015240 [Giardia intestinalis]|eukprot:XP_001708543.1 Hypothetical protein GL50803_15240 [Giardia lamblia ATCC 50803]
MSWRDTLDFLYGRNAQENPRPQDPTMFSVPCDEFFYTKFCSEITKYREGKSTPEALTEAFNQLANHTSIPLAAHAFWKDMRLFSCITEFFEECVNGKNNEADHHWTDMVVFALAKLVDTRAGVSTLESLPLEQLDTILVFLLNHATNFPRLWKITYEISCVSKLLEGYEKNIVRAGTDYIGSILNKFTRLQAQLENKRVVHTTLPEHKAVQEQITILKYVVSSVYNISVTCRDAFDLIIDTAPNTFLDLFKRTYDIFIVSSDYGLHLVEDSVVEMNTFIDSVILFDSSSSLSFSTGTLPRNLIILFGDFNTHVASTAALAFGRICSSNAAVHSVWNTLMFDENMAHVVAGFRTGLSHTDDAFREACCSALLSMLDGPFRVKKDVFKAVIFEPGAAERNADDPNYAALCSLFE